MVLERDITQGTVSSDNQVPKDEPGDGRETRVDHLPVAWRHMYAIIESCQSQTESELQLQKP